MKYIFFGSDTHCGSLTGLTPPEHNIAVSKKEVELYKLYQTRFRLWNWFINEVNTTIRSLNIFKFDAAMWNGDLIDGQGKKTGGTELLTSDRNRQVEIAKSVVANVPANERFFTFGSPYHTGNEEDFEENIAKSFNAQIDSIGNYNINDLQVNMKHHIANTNSVSSRFTALSGAQIRQLLWDLQMQQKRANLIIRSHVHRCAFVGDPASNFQGWTTPSLQGIGGKYGSRKVDGLPVAFGFLVLSVNSDKEWGITPHISPLKLQSSKSIKI